MKVVKMFFFIVVAMATACKSDEKAKLVAGEWQLKSMKSQEQVNLPEESASILFTDSTSVFGFAGCNRFFGTYSLEEKNKIVIKPVGRTMAYCPDMSFEDQYMKALEEVTNYKVEGNELKLSDAGQKWVLVFEPKDTVRRVGVAEDAHGCNAAAGYTWSDVRRECVRLFEAGIPMKSVNNPEDALVAYVVFSADSLKAEVFVPGENQHPVLERRAAADGYVWNQEDDDTFNLHKMDGKWVIDQREKSLYREVEN